MTTIIRHRGLGSGGGDLRSVFFRVARNTTLRERI